MVEAVGRCFKKRVKKIFVMGIVYIKLNSYICIEKKKKIMKWLFKTIVDGVVNTCYEFDSKEKAERWRKNYIEEMRKIGCYPLKGLELKVEQA